MAGFKARGVSGEWAGWAIAHPVFDRIEGAALILGHPVLGSQIRPCIAFMMNWQENSNFQN